ncbi:hypothetical protein SAY86_013486 [Trapa natans]|uniref:Phytocyanin domain-containing protein n=1 Tax=Trapa natans TaxID=22666 RepID=A0AAN7KYP6_TRANT|nr:hypothetical protein SAY86_013486 [Trapa natans]
MASPAQLCFFLFILVSAAAVVSATDHIVGANKGWNPGINYTLWANNQTFYVGDLICAATANSSSSAQRIHEVGRFMGLRANVVAIVLGALIWFGSSLI